MYQNPTNQSINQSINPTINQSINPTLNQSINQSIQHSINQSINKSINQSNNQSINQSTEQSINQSINKSIDQSINGCVFFCGLPAPFTPKSPKHSPLPIAKLILSTAVCTCFLWRNVLVRSHTFKTLPSAWPFATRSRSRATSRSSSGDRPDFGAYFLLFQKNLYSINRVSAKKIAPWMHIANTLRPM